MSAERKPIVPLTPEARAELLTRHSWVLIARVPQANKYRGYVELSFSMDWHDEAVNIWWSGPATSNLGGSFNIDGRLEIERHAAELVTRHPDWTIEIWDAKDPLLPIVIDWEKWLDAQAYNPNTLSGVTNKFAARNAPFVMKE